MKVLRWVLYWGAGIWAASGVVLALVPAVVLEDLFGQSALREYAWVRMVGILIVGMALLMVLVARRIEELWWWSWAFVLTGAGIAVLSGLNAAIGTPSGSPTFLWWLLAGVTGLFTAGLVAGLAKAGTERSPI
ncbi:MAG TPA: hypothetical protein VLB67_09400 [Acidimicrobiia bacterium]|nr:hypothetical protein [Acidimicrobiia bacterium]